MAYDASEKALFIQQLMHDIQGDFLGVTTICGSMKKNWEEKKDISELLDILLENCRTYKYKLGNYLEFTRLESGLCKTVRSAVNIRQLLNRVIDEYESLWIEKEARIEVNLSSEIPEAINCDEDRVVLMVSNLFVNAIQFSPKGSLVAIAVGFPDAGAASGHWFISVTDNGNGMTGEQQAAAFSYSTTERSVLCNRAGLGLIVTRWLAEDVLGGRMQLTSHPGQGVSVLLSLPFYPYD
jgi:two-component system, NarL family, sensor histidine kinase EvgS